MAQVVLGGIGGAVGGGIGRIVGSTVGRMVDNGLVAALGPARQVGPRLETLRVQGTAEGAPTACVFGRARVTGQVIWAARFLERRNESGGGKGGPRTVDHAYSLSFAVALCEGEIDGVGRVWADGQPMDLTGVTMRVHRGTEDQTPDPLIEAVEGTSQTGSPGGAGGAPAYRGTAYVVFEDLALGAFGDRVPQLAFEVFRRPRGNRPRLEDRLEGVCLIPGAGEFALATEAVLRRDGLTRTAAENVHAGEGRADLLVSLDQLQAQLPKLKRVSLVVGWFGSDPRAGHCLVRPGVERRDKPTEPVVWSVAGVERHEAYEVSRVDGAPAYGGTPSDGSVRQAIRELKARGLEVTLYPFVFMDCPGYPWRGRVAGTDGAGAAAEIAALFGTADGWGLRRMALHYAGIAAEEGADGLLIASEMRGATSTRDEAGGFPATAELRALAAECRAIAGPGVRLSYAADWSEYSGWQGNGERLFPLDPLWADANIDHVSIDWYPPLTDWREGDGGVDAALWRGPADPGYLAAGVAGGDGFDWYYADEADRAAQVRTPIVDTAHGEHWLFRAKDLKGWWSNFHHERPGGVRAAEPTAWVPGMKPVRLSEFGCAAVDRGGNAPNLFQDPKSSESALPPYSTGARDDGMQRAALEAVLAWFGEPANNPASAVYGGPMLEAADAWCWDARPYPAFPGRADVWADAGAWRAGHWLNGRLSGEARDLIEAVLARGGLGPEAMSVEGVAGAAAGYVIDRPMRTRDALEPLLAAFGAVAAERGGRVAVVGETEAVVEIAAEALALPDEGSGEAATRTLEARPGEARVRFIDETAGYQTGSVVVRSEDEGATGGGVDLDLPVVCGSGLARAAAERVLVGEGVETLTLGLGPLERMRLEPGDGVRVEGREGLWRVERLSIDERPTATLRPVVRIAAEEGDGVRAEMSPAPAGAPFVRLLDLPPLVGAEEDARPLAAVAAEPWRAMRLHAGASAEALTARADVAAPATVGVLVEALGPGVMDRWDRANALVVRIEGRAPESAAEAAVLGGANALAVETALGWEIVQFRTAALVSAGVWRLTGLLRGRQGTEGEMRAGADTGAAVVFLDPAPARAEIGRNERGLPLICRAGPAGAPPGGAGFAETAFTLEGRHARPWSPCHLAGVEEPAGLRLRWIARSRLFGDGWDGEVEAADPMRFRLRAVDGATVRRTWEVEGTEALYAAEDRAADFPGGAGADARIAVAQWGAGFGWGAEAEIRLG